MPFFLNQKRDAEAADNFKPCIVLPGDPLWNEMQECEREFASKNGCETSDAIPPSTNATQFLFNESANAKPCQKCGSDFLWQDFAQNLNCIQCVEPPLPSMVAKVFQCVVRDGKRGVLDSTGVCLKIMNENRKRKRATKTQSQTRTQKF